jgi:tetratricopeptide (TPR) repeat protein
MRRDHFDRGAPRVLGAFSTFAAAMVASLALAGCAGRAVTGPEVLPPDGERVAPTAPLAPAARRQFEDGLAALARQDPSTCKATADLFLAAAGAAPDRSPTVALAHYNAGVAYQGCARHGDAKAQFQEALGIDAGFYRARVQLALYVFAESGETSFDATIRELGQAAVVDARFSDPMALVQLGLLHMKRGRGADAEGQTDLDHAKKFAQRALAVDDGFSPAYNLLALIHLESARQKAGRIKGGRGTISTGKEKKLDGQVLDLAALVCSQAIRKNPKYAPIYNTAGMIHVELGDWNAAVRAFDAARKLDPGFFEAQMNYAAVNLQFRGFETAEEAYRAAIRLRPSDYDAHIGLAHALRGRIEPTNLAPMYAAASAELAAAKKIAPERPEAYYNEALLTQEYKADAEGKQSPTTLLEAKALFGTFIQKAGSSAAYADVVKRSKERIAEIDEIIYFLGFHRQPQAERKAAEAEARNRAAEAEARGEESHSDTSGAQQTL